MKPSSLIIPTAPIAISSSPAMRGVVAPCVRNSASAAAGPLAFGGAFGAPAQHAQQRAGHVDRVARGLVGGEREEHFPVGARRAHQRCAARVRRHEARGASRSSASQSSATRSLPFAFRDARAREQRETGGAQPRFQARGALAPADVAELQVAPGRADRRPEQPAHALRERPRGVRGAALHDRPQRAGAGLVHPPPQCADGAGWIGDHPQPARHHRQHQRALAERLGDAAAHEAVVGSGQRGERERQHQPWAGERGLRGAQRALQVAQHGAVEQVEREAPLQRHDQRVHHPHESHPHRLDQVVLQHVWLLTPSRPVSMWTSSP